MPAGVSNTARRDAADRVTGYGCVLLQPPGDGEVGVGELEAEELDSRAAVVAGVAPGHSMRKGTTPSPSPGGRVSASEGHPQRGRALHGESRAGVEFASRAPRQPQSRSGTAAAQVMSAAR